VSPYLGAAFETLVAGDIRRMARALAPAPAIFHWRSHGGAEVDLVLERDGRLWPIEIKCTSAVTRRHEAGFRALRETYPSADFGMNCIVAAVPFVRQSSPETAVVPWDLI
jgi:predicted AAA+ superfamily ATPase